MSYFFAGFFMQAFFLLNGFTSHFDKPFKPFLLSSFKGLIIPYISFSIITKLLDGICFGNWSIMETVANGDQHWIWIDESYWFLTALFFARIIYWFAKRYVKNDLWRGVLMLALLLLGTFLNHIYDGNGLHDPAHFDNYLHYRNALCMVIFLWVGDWLKQQYKNYRKYYPAVALIYIVAIFLSRLTHHVGIIGYTHSTTMDYVHIPVFLFYAITGSIAAIWLAEKINHNRLLEYFGRGSIVVYMIHFFYLKITVLALYHFIQPYGYVSTVTFYMISFIVVAILCAITIRLMELPYLRKLIGK